MIDINNIHVYLSWIFKPSWLFAYLAQSNQNLESDRGRDLPEVKDRATLIKKGSIVILQCSQLKIINLIKHIIRMTSLLQRPSDHLN